MPWDVQTVPVTTPQVVQACEAVREMVHFPTQYFEQRFLLALSPSACPAVISHGLLAIGNTIIARMDRIASLHDLSISPYPPWPKAAH